MLSLGLNPVKDRKVESIIYTNLSNLIIPSLTSVQQNFLPSRILIRTTLVYEIQQEKR
jgi:hypothetical protein